MDITAIRGFNDILPEEAALFKKIEDEAISVFSSYGFSEIRLPLLEKTELFLRSIGETTDIVEKQMYSFTDRHGESLSLRPEGTAPLVRAYIEHKLYNLPVARLFYRGPMFRYERPQKGRYRQFYQIGAEVLGEKSPGIDAEALLMLSELFLKLGVEGATIEINSLGCPDCRPAYKAVLKKFLEGKKDSLCSNCSRRIEHNPLRALDCKTPSCVEITAGAPSILDSICGDCSAHFEGLKNSLAGMGVKAGINPRMVRGLDYYTRTTFEVTAKGPLGSQNAVAAGGRYDALVSDLGGPKTPCFGFAIGMERLSLLIGENIPLSGTPVYFIFMGAEAEKKGVEMAGDLRKRGLKAVIDYGEGSLKSALKRADRAGAEFVAILGEDELKEGVITVKDMRSGTQEKLRPEEFFYRLLPKEKSS